MKLVHIKLKNGIDLIAEDLGKGMGCVNLMNPVQVKIHPTKGFYAQSYLLFSVENSVIIDNSDIVLKSDANKRAEEIYESFFEEVKERDFIDRLDDVSDEEAEEHLVALIDSRDATKH